MLVLSTVHQAEDPRIRWRTVAALAVDRPVRYASKGPSPSDTSDHEWVELRGGRVERMWHALRQAWRGDVGVVSLHDPELLPLGLLIRVMRRAPVVFDVHEDIPAQIGTKQRVPRMFRPMLARVAAFMLRVAERSAEITLAEPNYRHLFRHDHPVLPNYPDLDALPDPMDADGSVVYVGDVTEARGALLAIEAVAGLDEVSCLRLVGRCEPRLAARLQALATERGVELHLPGFLPHPEAMRLVAAASVGLSPLSDIPNYRRSLPTKTLEYLATGVPVVASDLEGTASVLSGLDGVTLVPPGDVTAWRDAIVAVLRDPTVRARTAESVADVRARFRFSPEDVRAVYDAAARSRV